MAMSEQSIRHELADLDRRMGRLETLLGLRPGAGARAYSPVPGPAGGPVPMAGGAGEGAVKQPPPVPVGRRSGAGETMAGPWGPAGTPGGVAGAAAGEGGAAGERGGAWRGGESTGVETGSAGAREGVVGGQMGPPPLPAGADWSHLSRNVSGAYPQEVAAGGVVPDYVPVATRRPPVAQTELEQTIGLKVAGWVGAVVVVIGVALGIKFAYDQRWFEILPPGGRLAMMSLAAFALIGAGEVVYRRVHRFAAACLFGAGVATLFLVSYAGFGYYQLYTQQTAFVLMALSTIAGAAVAIRGNMASIGVLAQIGGNLAPILLRTDHPQLVPFLSYLLTLQIVALVLAWWGGGSKWWTLRGMALATISLWLTAVIGGRAFAGGEGWKLAFCLIYAGFFQIELVLSAMRSNGLGAARGATPGSVADAESPAITPTATRGLTFSMLVTALLTAAILCVLRDASEVVRGGWVIGLAGACAAAGFLLSGRNREQPAAESLRNLGIGFRIQAAALIVVAVPVALSGVWVVLGWATLALAFAVMGNLLRLRISRWAGVMVWRLAVLYLGWWTISGPFGRDVERGPHSVWFEVLGADVRAYTVIAWALAIVGHAVAWLIHQEGLSPVTDSDRKFQRLAWVTNGLAGLVWVTASVAGLPPAGATFAILVYAWLLLGADLLNPRMGLVLQSAAVVALATVKWMAVDTLADRLSPNWSAAARQPVFNAVMGVGVLISLSMALLYKLRRDVLWSALTRRAHEGAAGKGLTVRGVSPAAPLIALAAALVVVMTVGLSFEIDRVIEAAARAGGAAVWPPSQMRQMAWTVLWTVAVAGFVALARRLEPDDFRRPGWVRFFEVLALLLAVKFLLVDTVFFRLSRRPPALAPAIANFQTFTALVVVSGLVLVSYLMTRPPSAELDSAGRRKGREGADGIFAVAGFLAVLVVLWGGTLEIDRWFERLIAGGSTLFAEPRRAKQVAFSIFWSVFAVSAVVAGFRFRTTGLRYFGLGLFAVTLLKILLVDMSQVQTGYRVLSFLGLGLLLLGTSVLYGKLSPLLLREPEPVAR